MQPGRLIELLIFERGTETVSASGEPVMTWAECARARAELVSQARTEETQERGAVSVETATFRARWTTVRLGDRLVWQGHHWCILSLSEIGRREGLEIKVERTGS